jgi:hypothetical protein
MGVKSIGTRFKIAGQQLMKANLGNAMKAFTIPEPMLIGSSNYRNGPGKWFFDFAGGIEFNFTYSGLGSAVRAYQECAPLNAIINKKAQAYINGKTWLLNDKGKEATGAVAERLRKLMKRPNPFQTWDQFEAQAYIYQQLFGYSVILPIKPVGFDNSYATAVYNLCPAWLDIEPNEIPDFKLADQKPYKRISWSYGGVSVDLSLSDVYIMKDITPSFCMLHLPESRVKVLGMPINNIIGVYESRNTLINYRGAQGFLTPDKDPLGAIPLTAEGKEELQKDFRRYGLRHEQWQVIISNAQLKWNQMGYATKDLMLFEEVEDDIQRLCDEYNWPYELTASSNGATFENKNEAKKLAYQDAIIPESIQNYSQWNEFFSTEKYGLILEKDYSHIPALQEDAVKKAQARKQMNDALMVEFMADCITRNRWRELMGEDTVTGDDKYYSQLVAEGRIIPLKLPSNGSYDQNKRENNGQETGSKAA